MERRIQVIGHIRMSEGAYWTMVMLNYNKACISIGVLISLLNNARKKKTLRSLMWVHSPSN